MKAIDIDRIAHQAMKESKPKPDLLKDGFPFEPGGFYLVIEPIDSKQESSGEHGSRIVLAPTTQEAEQYQIQVGRVLKCGPSAFEGKTESGIVLANFTADIQRAEDLIGKYVIYQRHTGNRLTLRSTGQAIVVLTLSELLGVTQDPEAWRFYI